VAQVSGLTDPAEKKINLVNGGQSHRASYHQGSPMKTHIVAKNSEFNKFCIKRRDIRNLLQAYSAAITLFVG